MKFPADLTLPKALQKNRWGSSSSRGSRIHTRARPICLCSAVECISSGIMIIIIIIIPEDYHYLGHIYEWEYLGCSSRVGSMWIRTFNTLLNCKFLQCSSQYFLHHKASGKCVILQINLVWSHILCLSGHIIIGEEHNTKKKTSNVPAFLLP